MTPEERFIQWCKIAIGITGISFGLYAIHLLRIIAQCTIHR